MRLVKLTEQDLELIIKKVIKEQRALPTISKGQKGDEILKIQQKLVANGYNIGKGGPKGDGVDGNFGPQTQKAIKDFQTSMKLPPTGSIDQQTRNYLFSLGGGYGFSGLYPGRENTSKKTTTPLKTKPTTTTPLKTKPTTTKPTTTKPTTGYKLTPRIDKELEFIKQRGMDNKPFFIYDPLQNLIYLFNKGGVLVDYTSVVDGESKQQKGKEYSFAQWCKDSGLSHNPSICTDVNVKTAEDCSKQPMSRNAKWVGSYCKVNPYYGSLPSASRFFPKGIYDIRALSRTENYAGVGKNTFKVGREGSKEIIPAAIHGIPNSEPRLTASKELEKYLQKNVESGQVPEEYLNNTKSISKANQSFGCVGVPAKFIENPKVQSLSLGARLFVMGDDGKDFLVQNSGEFFNKLGGNSENCVNPESLAARMSGMA
jgi:hypothetical protein